MRTVEYYDIDTDQWVATEWSTLVSGIQIRMNEENGDPVLDGTGVYVFQTASDAYTVTTTSGEADIWAVETYDPDPYKTLRTE